MHLSSDRDGYPRCDGIRGGNCRGEIRRQDGKSMLVISCDMEVIMPDDVREIQKMGFPWVSHS